jgi:hypothetical protein
VGDTDTRARIEAQKVWWHNRNTVLPPQFFNIPGLIDARIRAQLAEQAQAPRAEHQPIIPPAPVAQPASGKRVLTLREATRAPIEDLAGSGLIFAGNPDTVFEELRDFFYAVGGFGHLIIEIQGSTMNYESTVRSMELFSTEVLTRFRAEVYDTACNKFDDLGRVVVD